jgi:asparagine synthase (glutamine-hydrolysing)
MTSRGPDAAGVWISPDQRVGLGHRRLSIIDLSEAGSQPMVSDDGKLRVVFNGEIYNYPEIRARLEARGVRFRSHSDTECLLHLYAEKGVRMVDELRGMYAFILWDQASQGVLLGRDPLGIKPLYYHDDGRVLRAASQVKALLADRSCSPSPDPAGHVGYFLWGHVPEPFTLFKDLRMLPPGSTLWVDSSGKHSARRFYDLAKELAELGKGAADADPGQFQEALREALQDSVRHHLLADVPVGVFLSAGLDSSLLASLATTELGLGNLRTVTLGFEEYKGTEHDETILSNVTARQLESIHRTTWISANEFSTCLDHLFYSMDQPSIDGVNTYFVSKITVDSGLKVALSGVGGDELFGGYPSFTKIPKMVNGLAFARRMPRQLGRSVRRMSSSWAGRFASPKYAGLLEYGSSYSGAYLLMRAMFMPWELDQYLDPDMVREGLNELQVCQRLGEATAGMQSERLKVSSLELSWYMRNQLLRDSDWAGMAHSLEIRTPLVDMELFRRLAPMMASKTPPTKIEMALSAATRLPDEILNRRKTGFNIPVHEWLMKNTDTPAGKAGPGAGKLREWAQVVYRECTSRPS